MELSSQELEQLINAKNLLTQPSMVDKLNKIAGNALMGAIDKMSTPAVMNKIANITQSAIEKAADVALFSIDKELTTSSKFSNNLHKGLAILSGVGGGFFGLVGFSVELPAITILILRSIADIARIKGLDIDLVETKLDCLNVLGYSRSSSSHDLDVNNYFESRLELLGLMATGTNMLSRTISRVAAYFAMDALDLAAAQSIPLVGAASGGAVNYIFMKHYQDIADGYFTIRMLEKQYGTEFIQNVYENIT